MDELTKAESPKMFNAIAARYDFVNFFISLGQHKSWRRQMLTCLPQGLAIKVLDIATGTGDVALTLSRVKEVAQVDAIDLSEEMLAIAGRKIKEAPSGAKIRLHHRDAMKTGFADETFDAVTMSFGIRNVTDPLACLQECYRILKPGGRVIILESGRPDSPLLGQLNQFYVKVILPKLGRLLSGHSAAYSYLNETICLFPSGRQFLTVMRGAGLSAVGRRPLFFGSVQLYWGTK